MFEGINVTFVDTFIASEIFQAQLWERIFANIVCMVKSFEGDHQTDEVGEGQEACECSDTFHFSWE